MELKHPETPGGGFGYVSKFWILQKFSWKWLLLRQETKKPGISQGVLILRQNPD